MLAGNPDSATTLESMRKRYDQELAKWKQHAVDYNDYQRYSTLFDRTIPLADKRAFMVKERKADPNRRRRLKGDPNRTRQLEKRKKLSIPLVIVTHVLLHKLANP